MFGLPTHKHSSNRFNACVCYGAYTPICIVKVFVVAIGVNPIHHCQMASWKLKANRPSPDWILKQKRNGKTYRELGLQVGCSFQNIQAILMRAAGRRDELIKKHGSACSKCG